MNFGMPSARSLTTRIASALLAAGFCFPSFTAQANVGEAFGFGSRSSALGGISVANDELDGFSAYANPAMLASPADKRRLFLSFGLKLMSPSMTPISGVVVENGYVSDLSTPRTGAVDTDYRSTFGQELGFVYRLFPDWNRFTIGFTSFLPLDSTAYLDSGEAYQPEYFLHRSRTQRPQFEFATALMLSDTWSFGAGAHLGFSLTSNATVFLQTTANHPSSARISASLKPKISPYFGLLYQPSRRFHLGLTTRVPLKSSNTLILNSSSRVLGNFGALDILLNGTGTMFYDPLSVELGLGFDLSTGSKLFLQADYQFWQSYESPTLAISNATVPSCTGAGCSGLQISSSNNPTPAYRNIFVPRIGQEWRLSDRLSLRYGYSYRPSILQSLPTGAGNAVDPARHQFGLGLGVKTKDFLGIASLPAQIDFSLGYHALETQSITKSAGNEAGVASDQKIGAPGYTAGGKILGGGVSLTLGF